MAACLLTAGVLAGACAAGINADVFAGFRAQTADALFPSRRIDPRIVVVGIDRRSILEQGQLWPWPRDVQAALVRDLTAAGVSLQVFDVVYGLGTGADRELVSAISSAGNVVLASNSELVRPPHSRLFEASAVTNPAPNVAAVAAAVGSANVLPDPGDGVVRSLPLVVESTAGDFIPALTLAAAARLAGQAGPPIVRPRGVQLGDSVIPTAPLGLLEVNYSAGLDAGTPRAPFVSAIDVLRGRIDHKALAGKVALVGITEPTLGDYHLTPDNKTGGVPGVFVQANALNTVLTRSYLSHQGQTEVILWVFGLALLVALATRARVLWIAPFIALAALVGYVVLAFRRFDSGLVMDLIYPPLAIVLSFIATLALRVGTEVRERRLMVRLLGQYVPASVARHLLGRPGGRMPAAGTITFLFTDVVGSTALWDAYPHEMSLAMRRHDILVDEAVETSGGAVVRPRGEGDSRFAVFVRPVDAVAAAGAIQRAFAKEPWSIPEPMRLRVALHTGEAELREGDYYGTAVNRCARLRSSADPGQVLLSALSAGWVRDTLPPGLALRDLGARTLKDFPTAEHVFALDVDGVVALARDASASE